MNFSSYFTRCRYSLKNLFHWDCTFCTSFRTCLIKPTPTLYILCDLTDLFWLCEHLLCTSFLTCSVLEAVIRGSFLAISSTTASTSVLLQRQIKPLYSKLHNTWINITDIFTLLRAAQFLILVTVIWFSIFSLHLIW